MWQSNVNGRLAPDATGKTDRPLVGASPAHTAVRRSTKSTTRTFPRYAASSPSAARSARAGSRERAAAIRARSRAPSSARASLRCCRTSPRAGASAGNAASGPAVARAETGSGPERTATRELDAPSEPRNPRPRHEPKPQQRRDRHLAHGRAPDCPLSGDLYTRPRRRVRGRPSTGYGRAGRRGSTRSRFDGPARFRSVRKRSAAPVSRTIVCVTRSRASARSVFAGRPV